MVLEISGNNSMQLVHLHRKSKDLSMNGLVHVHDEDEISLHCEGFDADVSMVQSLVRFRVLKIDLTTIESTPVGHDGGSDCVIDPDESIQCQTPNDCSQKCSNSDALDVKQRHCATIKDRSEIPAAEAVCDLELKNSNESDQASDGVTSPTLTAVTKNHGSQSEEESPTQIESAPLTMPMHFLEATTSNSYQLPQKTMLAYDNQQSQSHIDSGVTSSQTTPQRGNTSSKRKHQDIDYEVRTNITSDFEKEAPKSECSQVSVPMSSLTYDQLRQLHEKSSGINTEQHASVRNAVLSLTLALTSNASAWDSSFINAYNEKESMKEESSRKHKRWMPRLLHGTDIILHQRELDK
ncbi:hypothetical protein ACHAWO_000754 [Cyclotella atomus]|uniref:Uncharacterized protein n=1 Tax=Cyclotella atomus TaxID=382360 RepID=A0ABD3P458_9STRA